MTQMEVLDAAREGAGGYKVDVGRGERVGRAPSMACFYSAPMAWNPTAVDRLFPDVSDAPKAA